MDNPQVKTGHGPFTFPEIAAIISHVTHKPISKQRVHQIYNKAMRKMLRAALRQGTSMEDYDEDSKLPANRLRARSRH